MNLTAQFLNLINHSVQSFVARTPSGRPVGHRTGLNMQFECEELSGEQEEFVGVICRAIPANNSPVRLVYSGCRSDCVDIHKYSCAPKT